MELHIWIEGEDGTSPNEFELLTGMAQTVIDYYGSAVRYEVVETRDFPTQFTEFDLPTEEARQVFLNGWSPDNADLSANSRISGLGLDERF